MKKESILSELLYDTSVDLKYSSNLYQSFEQLVSIKSYYISHDQLKVIKYQCPKLKHLSLISSQRKQTIQLCTQLQSLQSLDIPVDDIDETISEFIKMTKLKSFGTANLIIQDKHIQQIVDNMPLLQQIKIGYTKMLTQKSIFKLLELKNLTKLKFLQCYSLKKGLIEEICRSLGNLQELIINNSRLQDLQELINVKKLSNLKILNLQATILSKIIFSELIQNLPQSLTQIHLSLSNQNFSEQFKIMISKNPNLKRFAFYYTSLKNKDLQSLIKSQRELQMLSITNIFVDINNKLYNFKYHRQMHHPFQSQSQSQSYKQLRLDVFQPCLINLKLNRCIISDQFIKNIFKLQHLETLEIRKTEINNKFVIYFSLLKKLKFIEIDVRLMSQQCFNKIFKNLKNLIKINRIKIDSLCSKQFNEQRKNTSRCWNKLIQQI